MKLHIAIDRPRVKKLLTTGDYNVLRRSGVTGTAVAGTYEAALTAAFGRSASTMNVPSLFVWWAAS